MLHHRRNAVLVMALAVLAGACENPNTPDPPTTGSLTVIVETTGNLPDPDGYQLTRTGTAPVMDLPVNGSMRADSLAPGSYSLHAGQGVALLRARGRQHADGAGRGGADSQVTFRVRCERNGLA